MGERGIGVSAKARTILRCFPSLGSSRISAPPIGRSTSRRQSLSQLDYNSHVRPAGVGAMRIARGLAEPRSQRLSRFTSNDSLKSAFVSIARRRPDRRIRYQHDRAPRGWDRDHEHHARERDANGRRKSASANRSRRAIADILARSS